MNPAIDCQLALSESAIDDAALAALDAASASSDFNSELLSTSPAMAIRRRIEALLTSVRLVNPAAMMNKQGWFSTFTGADVEARLIFELASQDVLAAGAELTRAAEQGRRAMRQLAAAKESILADQLRLEDAIAGAQGLLAAGRETADRFLLSRFERRLANIEAIHAANTLTLAQVDIAVDLLRALIDRCTDIGTVILPLWQRNVVAMLHATGSVERKTAYGEFAGTHSNLARFLEGNPVHDR